MPLRFTLRSAIAATSNSSSLSIPRSGATGAITLNLDNHSVPISKKTGAWRADQPARGCE